MKMTIKVRYKLTPIGGTLTKFYSPTTTYRESGHESVKAMQKDLLLRFPNRPGVRNRKIKNGIVRRERRDTFVITLESNF